jgi:hypothetical protein
MASQQHGAASIVTNVRTVVVVLFVAGVFATSILAAPAAQVQTYTILHAFSSTPDGSEPTAGPTMDHAGNLYRTTSQGWWPKEQRRGVGNQ